MLKAQTLNGTCIAAICVFRSSRFPLSAADIKPDWLAVAVRTVFFVGVITPWAFWVMLSMNSTAVPLAEGLDTGVCVAFAPMFAGVRLTLPVR